MAVSRVAVPDVTTAASALRSNYIVLQHRNDIWFIQSVFVKFRGRLLITDNPNVLPGNARATRYNLEVRS
jgi:hypothetical protein